MKIIIIANGTISDPRALLRSTEESDVIIAVDGGTNHCNRIGVQPDAIIGDMDSLPADKLEDYQSRGVEIILHPEEKDATDLELALDYAVKKNPSRIIIWGGIGTRWDMSTSNIMLLTLSKYQDFNILMEDEYQRAFIVKRNQDFVLSGVSGAKVSLIPLCDDVTRITTTGLKYALNSDSLYFGRTRGVSNVFDATQATVYYTEGILLCVIFKSKQEI